MQSSMGCLSGIRTPDCLTVVWRTNDWATPHPTEPHCTLLSNSAPYRLCHTLMSYTTPYCASPFWATLHPTEQLRTLPDYATPSWATPHPTVHRPSELHCTLLSNSAPYQTMPHPHELHHTLLCNALLSYALQPTELRLSTNLSLSIYSTCPPREIWHTSLSS
jgi:hypothetical protein